MTRKTQEISSLWAGVRLRDVGVYPILAARWVSGAEPIRVQADIERDPATGTDVHTSACVDFGDFDLSFYCSGRMALRQHMVFHGDAGFVEVHAPFNAGLYDHHRIDLHDLRHEMATTFRFPETQQYQLEVEAFVEAAIGTNRAVLPLESSLHNQKVIDALFHSADVASWVSVDAIRRPPL